MQNLPPKPYAQLIGRDRWAERVLALLRNGDAPPIINLTGMGGIGKSALAYEVAQRAVTEGGFKDVLWESAKQYEIRSTTIVTRPNAAITRERLFNSLAQQLGRFEMLQLHPDERRLRLQYILQHSPYLVVVDNLETMEDGQVLVDELAGMLFPSRAILTSRIRLPSRKHVRAVSIKGLSEVAAITFLRQEAHAQGVLSIAGAKQLALKRIARVTGGLPLAMKFLIAQVAAGLSLDDELEHLVRADNQETLYRFIYFDLWSTLSVPAQKILIAISAFSASVPRFLLQPVAHVSDGEFETAIDDLIVKSLVELSDRWHSRDRRYSVHELTRHFINSDLRAVWEAQKVASQTK